MLQDGGKFICPFFDSFPVDSIYDKRTSNRLFSSVIIQRDISVHNLKKLAVYEAPVIDRLHINWEIKR